MSGQFVLSHKSKFDKDPGGLLHFFEDQKHLVLYDKDNFYPVICDEALFLCQHSALRASD